MAWKCHQCGFVFAEPGLDRPILHFLETEHSDIRPDRDAAAAWKALVES
jgi:hypothetical protein